MGLPKKPLFKQAWDGKGRGLLSSFLFVFPPTSAASNSNSSLIRHLPPPQPRPRPHRVEKTSNENEGKGPKVQVFGPFYLAFANESKSASFCQNPLFASVEFREEGNSIGLSRTSEYCSGVWIEERLLSEEEEGEKRGSFRVFQRKTGRGRRPPSSVRPTTTTTQTKGGAGWL